MKLPDRLRTIAGFIENGAAVADIGTDHGMLPVYLAQNRLARRIIASDISEGSLSAARRTAAKYGVADKIAFTVAPGLSGVAETDADTIVLAGMGGETIAGILKEAPWTKRGARLILQPQTKTAELCIWLRLDGYIISDAKLARDNGRFYVVLLVRGGASESSLEPEIELLARLMFNRDPLLSGYLEELIAKTNKALEGIKSSGEPGTLDMANRLAVYISMKEVNDSAYSQ